MMSNTRRLTLCAVMLSLALALSYMERFIPLQMIVPLPGVKLGLANIVSLISLYLLGVRSAYAILVLRCLLSSVFSGSATAFLFSITGGTIATMVMWGAGRIPILSIYGVSILGAAAHNIGQIIAAMLVMQSVYIGAYLPYLLIVGIFTGFATGAAGSGVLRAIGRADWAGIAR